MNPLSLTRKVLIASILVSMITTLFFMLPGLYMWFPLLLSMIHVVVSIVGLIGVLGTMPDDDSGYRYTVVFTIAVLLETIVLLISVIYWGASSAREFRRWYNNGAIVIGLFMFLIDAVQFIAAGLFLGFIHKAKANPESVNTSDLE